MDKKIPKKPIGFGFFATRPHKKLAIITLICVFFAVGFDRMSILAVKNLADTITAKPLIIDAVWSWAVLYVLLFLVEHVFWRAGGFIGMRWFMNFRSTAYHALFEHLTLHSKDYFNSRFAGSLANKIANAVDGAEGLFEKILWEFIPVIFGVIWYTVITWVTDFRLGLITAAWSIFFLGINIFFARKMQPYSYKFAESLSTLKGRIVDSLSNISLVHEYAHVAGEQQYIKRFVKKQRDAGLTNWNVSEWVLVINGLLIFIFMVSILGTSIYLFQKHLVSIGAVVMAISIVGSIMSQLLFIGQEMKQTAAYYGESREGLEEILSDHMIVDRPGVVDVSLEKGLIEIDKVDFQYENSKVFTNFSLTIFDGQKVGLVGRSGAGKTTFVALLLRHYDVQSGEIKIDGHNISEVKLESLRRAIAYVPQDTSLFHRTIKENISYSKPEATYEDVKIAAKQAQADEFINKLPKGYETLVGERGVKLSGGQRQRIAIARAFLKNAPILILDEATSSLDSQSEQAIQESLEKLMKGRTVIAIAHRLSTLKEMDRIVVMTDGKIVEDGNPEDLLKKEDGIFKNMWDHQIKGFILDE